MTDEQRITLAVPYVDKPELLRKTLNSIVAQTSAAFETVLIDNSRTLVAHDAAKEIVGQFGAHKIAYSENEEHLDINVNFNRCIDIANTDLVAIVASDDELLPTFVSDLLALADRQAEAAALFLPARIIDLRSNPAFSFPDFIKRFTKPLGSSDLVLSGEASLRSLLRGNYISMLCFRKSKLGVLRFDPALRFCGDLDLWGRILLSDRAIAGSRGRPGYAYRRHGMQGTAQMGATLYRFQEEALVYNQIGQLAEEKGWSSVVRVARAKDILKLNLGYLMATDLLSGRVSALPKKWHCLRGLNKTEAR